MSQRLAHPLHELLDGCARASSPEKKTLELFAAIEHAVRTEAVVLLCAHLRGSSSIDPELARILEIERLGVGQWMALLEILIARDGSGLCGEFRTWYQQHQLDGRFKRLIEFRNDYAHGRGEREPSALARIVERVEQDLRSLLTAHPSSEHLLLKNESVHVERDAHSLDCTPLLLPASRDGALTSVLCFSHRDDSEQRAYYTHASGGSGPCIDQSRYEQLLGLLHAKSVAPLSRRAPRDAGEARALKNSFAALTSRTLERLQERGIHRPESFLERMESGAALDAFVRGASRLFVLLGPEGSGRSSFLCWAAQRRVARGEAVAFTTADRLDGNSFPESLAPLLESGGKLAGKLSQASLDSSDDRMVVMIDDALITGGRGKLLESIVRYVEGAPANTRVRVVISLQPSEMTAFQASHPGALDGSHVRVARLPGFSAHEVRLLGKALPLAEPTTAKTELREKALACILASNDETTRRPGVLKRILESASPALLENCTISASTIRAEQFRSACPNRTPRKQLALRLARRMLELKRTDIDVEDDELVLSKLFYERDGSSTPDYHDLLETGFLVETGDATRRLIFGAPAMFQFAASQLYVSCDPLTAIAELCEMSERFQPALGVAAQVAVCHCDTLTNTAEAELAKIPHPHRAGLLHSIADLDRSALLALSPRLLHEEPARLLALFEMVLAEGQPRTAELGLAQLTRTLACSERERAEARLRRAEALWILDDYEAIAAELSLASEHEVAAIKMQAMIAGARGDFADARSRFDELLAALRPDTHDHAEALMCSGPTLLGLGLCGEAEARLRAALAFFEAQGDERYIAETSHNLGQALVVQERYEEAEALYRRSLALNETAGTLIGTGIVIGLLGELKSRRGLTLEARHDLEEALDIARRTDNRWREAWIARRLAAVLSTQGATNAAEELAASATRIYAELGCQIQ